MSSQIEQWLNLLRVTMQPTTVQAYEWELRSLSRSVADLSGVTTADLTEYLARRRLVDGCGDAAIKRSVAAFRSFFRFVQGDRSAAAGVPFPKVKRKRQRSLDWDQALMVMTVCDTSRPRGKRDLALIALALDTGLREAEICRLKMNRVDIQRRQLVVPVKGGDDSRRVFSEYTAASIGSWLQIRSAYALPEVDTLFVGVGGTTPGRSLTPSGLRVIFRRIGQAAGLAGFSPHDLRRTFATLSHKMGAPSRLVQLAGGWSDIRMIERYTQDLAPGDIDPYSPVNGLMGAGR